jgi:cell division protein ZapA
LSKVKPRTVDVEIYDQKYSLVVKSEMAEADVRRLAEFVDERMRQIAAAASTPDSLKIAILTALHLAQEIRELENYARQSEAIISKKSDEWTRALEQLLAK